MAPENSDGRPSGTTHFLRFGCLLGSIMRRPDMIFCGTTMHEALMTKQPGLKTGLVLALKAPTGPAASSACGSRFAPTCSEGPSGGPSQGMLHQRIHWPIIDPPRLPKQVFTHDNVHVPDSGSAGPLRFFPVHFARQALSSCKPDHLRPTYHRDEPRPSVWRPLSTALAWVAQHRRRASPNLGPHEEVQNLSAALMPHGMYVKRP